jgi:hypothetical protein
MKLYDLILKLMKNDAKYRDSDKELQWQVWKLEGNVSGNVMTYENFIHSISPETIRRTRQKIQETHPELRSSYLIQGYKDNIQDQKSTHIYRVIVNPLTEVREYV